ncbi:transcriptional regulator [Kickxella alabastrina]|uniref:Transcriptional regulator n=1 Tax=Kickxella alabastrina TaxID=61397 RepID=A0ACC1IFI0_9FUNG|nr:transcriptional regulator [Kickxella alabastrina]
MAAAAAAAGSPTVNQTSGRTSMSYGRTTPSNNVSNSFAGFQSQQFANLQQQQQQQQSVVAAYLQQQQHLRQQQEQLEHEQQQHLHQQQQQQARPDMSEFPSLGNPPGLTNMTAAQQQHQAAQLYRTIAGARSDRSSGQTPRPNLTPDDFPALSGPNDHGAVGFNVTPGSATGLGPGSLADLAPGAGAVDQASSQALSSAQTATAAVSTNGLETTSSYKPPTANLAKVAGSVGAQGSIGAADRFGMLGILTTNDYGFDVAKFGLPLPSAGLLYPTFGSPWTDQSQAYGLIEPDFKLPACYNASHPQPAKTKITSFMDETLFYVFYTMPRSEMQLVAAEELYRRQWRYHKELRLWLTKDPDSPSTARSPRGEQSVFIFFDPGVWQKVKKEYMVIYDMLEERTPLSAAATTESASAFRGGAQSVPPSLQQQQQQGMGMGMGMNSTGIDQDGSSAAAAQAQMQNLLRLSNANPSQQQQQLMMMRQRQMQENMQASGRGMPGQLAYSNAHMADLSSAAMYNAAASVHGMASQQQQHMESASSVSQQQQQQSTPVNAAEDVAAASMA